MRTVILIFTFFAFCQTLQSQSLEFGLLAGISIYNGDLSTEKYIRYVEDVRPAGGIFLRGVVHPKLAIRGSFFIGSLNADDKGRTNNERGLNFKSPLVELGFVGEIHPFRGKRIFRGPHISPYLFTGVVTYYFNPKTTYEGEEIELQPIGTEGQGLPNAPDKYSRVQVGIPIGLGLHIRVSEHLSIGAEFGGRKLFTDYIDDVGAQPVNYNILINGNGLTAGELSIRNPDARPTEPSNDTYRRGKDLLDWYYIGGLTVSFRIPTNGSNQFGCAQF